MANLKDRRCLDINIEVKLRSERESAGPSGKRLMGGREVSGHIVSDIVKKTIIIEECVQWNVYISLSQIGEELGQ